MNRHCGMDNINRMREVFGYSVSIMRRCLFRVLSLGPIPSHIAFILDGNRRFAKKENLKEGAGHEAGFTALVCMLKYCYEFGVKYVSIYAFSIDNFRRRPDEVEMVMDLMLEKIEGLLKEQTLVDEYGVRVLFIGNLKLLNERIRIAAHKVMKATANNTKCVLLICAAYTSTDEIAHAVEEACTDQRNKIDNVGVVESCKHDAADARQECEWESRCKIVVEEVEKHMYMDVAPDTDILFRTSGETRLSNFLLWQSAYCLLYSPAALWPEIGLRHLVWAVLNFQLNYSYLEKRRKHL